MFQSPPISHMLKFQIRQIHRLEHSIPHYGLETRRRRLQLIENLPRSSYIACLGRQHVAIPKQLQVPRQKNHEKSIERVSITYPGTSRAPGLRKSIQITEAARWHHVSPWCCVAAGYDQATAGSHPDGLVVL